jgi:chemotaxis protein MotB
MAGAVKRKAKSGGGAPEWMVTYGDMMGLLLCFFVIIVSMSEVKKDEKFLQVLESIRQAFGFEAKIGNVPIPKPVENSMLQQLRQIIVPIWEHNRGDTTQESMEAIKPLVTDVREGILIEIGGRIAFDRFSAVLRPEAEDMVAQLAAKIAGHNTVIKITGHATDEPLPADSPYGDPWGLSYARARAVADTLEHYGVRPDRLRLVAAGCQAPLEAHAYDEATRAANRRVEIVVTEALVQEYAGRAYTGELRE